jgi:hypothetical protein
MLIDFVVGGTAGMVSRTATAPIELFRMQRQNSFMPGATLREVFEKEGVRGLWKGNGANCARVFPQSAVNYAVYAWIDRALPLPPELRRAVSGAVGGAVSMAVTYPLETVRSRLSLQMGREHYAGIVHALGAMHVRDMLRGLGTSVVGYAQFTAISFATYFSYRDRIDVLAPSTEPLNKLLAGGLAGQTAICVTYPTDLVRRRLQLQSFDRSVPVYDGAIDCVKRILRKEGVAGLYRGFVATSLKLGPTMAIQFFTIDTLNSVVGAYAR